MKNILLIDDCAITGMLIKAMLKDCNVTSVETGHEALEYISENKYDIIILDNGLPDIKGNVIYNIIREKDEDVRIFLFSGGTDLDDLLVLNENNDILRKPFRMKELKDLIK